MAYIITGACCNDAVCVDVCPVDCIHPRPDEPDFRKAEQLYIDPRSCLDCNACREVCPVGAIHREVDLPEHLAVFTAVNAGFFAEDAQ